LATIAGYNHRLSDGKIPLTRNSTGPRIDSAQTLSMPRRFCLGERQRFAQSALLLGLDLVLGP